MSSVQGQSERAEQTLEQVLIRDLVEQHPETMPVLSEYGIDVCCGGGLTVPAAAEAHQHDPAVVLAQVRSVIRGSEK